VGGRFDRGLRRISAERTSLLSWLAESDQAEVLRTEGEIDLRDKSVVDVRARAGDATGESLVSLAEAGAPDGDQSSTSLFQR
jgi:hypothetical protein